MKEDDLVKQVMYLAQYDADTACLEFERNTRHSDYTDSCSLNKLKEKIKRKWLDEQKSPEEILLDKYKQERVRHFFEWLESIMRAEGYERYEKWKHFVLEGYDPQEDNNANYVFKKHMQKKLKLLLELYESEYGSIREVLRD